MENVQKLNGYVALVDVLGFRELVGRDDELSEVQRYIEVVAGLLDNSDDASRRELEYVLFSDNLVINTSADSSEALRTIVVACSELFFNLTKQGVALRGAIAYGPFMRSPTTRRGVILAGRPIVEAHYYQTMQNWIGIMLCPSVVRHNQSLKTACSIYGNNSQAVSQRLPICLQPYHDIPFHGGVYDGYAVVPMQQDVAVPRGVRDSLEETKVLLSRMKETAPDPESQRKYDATIVWLKKVRGDWSKVQD